VVGVAREPRELSYFALATNVLAILAAVGGAFTGAMMPLASVYESRGDRARLRQCYLYGTRLTLLVLVPSVLLMLVAGPELLALWVGSEVGTPAGQVLRILGVAHMAFLAASTGNQLMLGTNRYRSAAIVYLGEGVVNILLSCLLVRRFGVFGVAWATLIPGVAVHGILWPAIVRRTLGVGSWVFWRESILPSLIPALPALVVYATMRFFCHGGTLELIGSAFALVLVYAATALWMVLPNMLISKLVGRFGLLRRIERSSGTIRTTLDRE
jgi:O-antigen/teichoic acid export membrane protein